MKMASKDPQTNRSLDALADALLLPSGIDGVYARTAVFEDLVTLPCGLHLAPPQIGHRGPALSAGRGPPAVGALRLSEKLPRIFSAGVCCLSGSRPKSASTVERLRGRRGVDGCAQCRRSRFDAGRLLSSLSDRSEPRRSIGRGASVRCRE